jgi:hypothetical protein
MLVATVRRGSVKARAIASIVAVGLMTASIAGCTFVTPIATQNRYDASDGINTDLGPVKILNALVITGDGINGNLVGQAYNDTDQTLQLTVQYDVTEQQTITVTLRPETSTDFGYGASGQTLLPKIGTKAGGLLPLYLQYGDEPGKQVKVPVLSNDLTPYSSLLPTPPPAPKPIPTPTATATPGATDTATPSPTPTAG